MSKEAKASNLLPPTSTSQPSLPPTNCWQRGTVQPPPLYPSCFLKNKENKGRRIPVCDQTTDRHSLNLLPLHLRQEQALTKLCIFIRLPAKATRALSAILTLQEKRHLHSNYSCQHETATENKALVWLRNSQAKKASDRAADQQYDTWAETASEPIGADKHQYLKANDTAVRVAVPPIPLGPRSSNGSFRSHPEGRGCRTSPSDKLKPEEHKGSHEGNKRQRYAPPYSGQHTRVPLCLPGAQRSEPASGTPQ